MRLGIRDIYIGGRFRYQGQNTVTKDQMYNAEVVAIYPHHILLSIEPIENPNEPAPRFTEVVPYRWSIAKCDLNRTEYLYA